MRMKSYFSDSVQEAIDRARAELGVDAMLINSSKTDPELKELGRYEVVFGVPADVPAPVDTRSQGTRSPAAKPAPEERILRELGDLREQMESFRHLLSHSSASGAAAEDLSPEMARVFERLVSAGFSRELSRELTDSVWERMEPHRRKTVRLIREHRDLFARDLEDALLVEEIESRVTANAGSSEENAPHALMLVGAPGAGKTSSLVKLAFAHGIRSRRAVHFVSLDTLRLGGTDQLAAYARVLGASFRALEHESGLASEIALVRGDSLALIDTPGFAVNDEERMESFARAARNVPLEVQLVLPATLALPVAERLWQRFAVFQPAKLLLTHVDEIAGSAALLEFAIRSALPLSFLGCGQQIPEDLRPAALRALIEELLPVSHSAVAA